MRELGALLVSLLLAAPCLAQRVQVPLSLDAHLIESVLREQVFAGGRVRVNDDGSGCQYLELRDPHVRTRGGRVLLRTRAEARAGRAVAGRCLLALDWHGVLEFTQQPKVAGDGESVVLHTESWRVLRPDGGTDDVSTTIGRWLEQFLPAGLRRTRIGFEQPLRQLKDLLALAAVPGGSPGSGIHPDSLAIDGISVGDAGVTVTLGVDAMPASAPPQSAAPALSDAELAGLEQRLDTVDAFFTYTIKSVGGASAQAQSAELLAVVVELRRELVAILTEPRGRGADPARSLFLHAWDGLAPVLRRAAGQQPDAGSDWRYLTFIAAGDALAALDDLGPAAGIEISSDGLRRLARMLAPESLGDPLQHGDAVDAELRRTLGFGPPLPPPAHYDDATAIDRWLRWLIPSALAADGLDETLVKRLNSWVPRTKDMEVYLPMVRDVLRHVVAEQLRSTELEAPFRDVYRWLVFAAAWQESCWRQFVAKNDKRVPMQSASGDLGIMQINPKIWRGLYDLQGLRWDIVYNARAGADILEHYMIDYAVKHGEHRTTGAVDSLARSAYAAYNGGPSQYDRYRRSGSSARGRKVDALFYDKYRAVKGGSELAVTACYGR